MQNMSMQELIQAFLEALQSQLACSKSTYLAYEVDLRYFMDFLQQSLERTPTLGDFNTRHIAQFLEAERLASRRPNTVIRRRATLRSFNAFLLHQGFLQGSPVEWDTAQISQAIAPTHANRTPPYLDPSDINRLMNAMQASRRPRARRDQAILVLLLETGLSIGRLVSLNLSDLEIKNNKVHLRVQERRDFWIPLNTASQPIQRYLREVRPEYHPTPDQSALFISQTGNRMSRQGVWQVLRYWGKTVGLLVPLSPRLAQYTAVQQLRRAGRPLYEIHLLLGHTNLLSTQALLRRLATPL